MDSIIAFMVQKEVKISFEIIPGNHTEILQPLDLTVNKSFKARYQAMGKLDGNK